MNGSLMDTTCIQITAEDTVEVSFLNISSISGIEYFDNLKYLKCNNNSLISMPPLPGTLTYLKCNNNLISGALLLPNLLNYLDFSFNAISAISQVPSPLIVLYGQNNQLTSLPSLSNALSILKCADNQLTSLPALPNNLSNLDCSNNYITNLPALPNSMVQLDCTSNQISTLPALPSGLMGLGCGQNQLTTLPTLPNSITIMSCHGNQLTSIPALPSALSSFNCSQNLLTNLPPIPNGLLNLFCYYNQLTILPSLPNSLVILDCANNQLINLPPLPASLTSLICPNNQLTWIPAVPVFMNTFFTNDNNILCFYNLPQVSSGGLIYNNPNLSCVPNITNYSLGLQLCLNNNTSNNPNNCNAVNISGKIYTDQNSNCSYDNTDLGANNIPVNLLDSLNNTIAQCYTYNGVYGFSSLQPGTYQVKIESGQLPILFTCGQSNSQYVTLDSANQTINNINFSLACESGYDIDLQSVFAQNIVFPGQLHHLYTDISNNENWYNLDCDSSISTGTVTIEMYGPVSYVSPLPGALTPQVNGNILTYNISNFNNLTIQSFGLKLLTDTTAQAGDQICVHVEINPTPMDGDTTNNVYDFCYNVVNSYDPNMKEVFPVNVSPGYDDWFTYTIHFQNTGNAPAFNIRLRDTLDANLDINSFEVRGYSHPAQISINGNILTVRFNNIMLPDSTTDYEGSMGYFQYRLKPLPNLPNGTQIENTAYIYFDYNAPIITNTTQNNFDLTVKTKDIIKEEEHYVLYPNPSAGIFMFKDNKSIKTVEVFNMMGELILSQGNAKII
ncbi:MAG: SdrD B-like domain-containing protein, partial [Bacteroidota bacterium]